MSDENIDIISRRKEDNLNKRRGSRIMTFFLILFVVILIIIANFISKDFLSIFLFLLMFGFPLLIIYRIQIASYLPDNIASYLIENTEEVTDDLQRAVKVNTNPLYVFEVQMLVLGLLSLGFSIFTLHKRKKEFIGLLTSIFFAVLALIFVNELF